MREISSCYRARQFKYPAGARLARTPSLESLHNALEKKLSLFYAQTVAGRLPRCQRPTLDEY